MARNLGRELAALESMTVGQLARKYAEVFGEPTRGRNKAWLARKVAWRMQMLAGGGLTERAKARAAELARDADLRIVPPRAKQNSVADEPEPRAVPFAADPRLPVAGTVLTRSYKGSQVRVVVRPDGFEYAGDVYPSLSAAAKAATGSHCNGFAFFRLGGKGAGS